MTELCLLGLDSGSTATKAVVFDLTGRVRGTGRRRTATLTPQPGRVERDMAACWEDATAAIRAALADASIGGERIGAVGVTAHGDGLYLLGRDHRPLGHGITSLDDRASGLVRAWDEAGVLDRALPLIGQRPYPYAAVSLLAWLRQHEPARYAAIGAILFCKDWLRLCLTGERATDLTEASTGFTDLHTQAYSEAALDLFGLNGLGAALPPMLEPSACAGRVTRAAAAATGLAAGTPVAAGLHDVTASAIGLGNLAPGALTMTAGTFSMNEVLWHAPRCDARWACRAGTTRGSWMSMAISPASSANLEWLTAILGADLDTLAPELPAAFAAPSGVVFHPFLFGSPYEAPASGGFFGLRGWHGRAHLARAVLEGIVFNHRVHVDALAEGYPLGPIRLTGGGTHTPLLGQLFADGLGRTLEVRDVREAAALGAALCGGVAAGLFADLPAAMRACCHPGTTYRPEPARTAALDAAFARYQSLIAALRPLWPGLHPDGAAA